ncbi:MAG: YwqG family protein [Fimbriimonadaceae bacterium]
MSSGNFEHLRVPAIQLVAAAAAAPSWLGGLPFAPNGFAWPRYGELPMSFLGQLDLAELGGSLLGLPARGYLYVFYDQHQSVWGYDPADFGSWRLIYWDGDARELTNIPPPPGLQSSARFNMKAVQGRRILTYPHDDSVPMVVDGRDLADVLDEIDYYRNLRVGVYGGMPAHQVGGHAQGIQDDSMAEVSQAAWSRTLAAGSDGDAAAPSGWRLLLQLDSDDATGFMWGDSGMLYFWIRTVDLAEHNFDNVWMILQCD